MPKPQSIMSMPPSIIMKQPSITKAATMNSLVTTLIWRMLTIHMPSITTPKRRRRMSNITADRNF